MIIEVADLISVVVGGIAVLLLIVIAWRDAHRRSHYKKTATHRSKSTSSIPSTVSLEKENAELREQLKAAKSSNRFFQQYIDGLAFEVSTLKKLAAEIPVEQIFHNIVSECRDEGNQFQLDLVVLSKDRLFVIECKNWKKASCDDVFLAAAATRFWVHCQRLYARLSKELGSAPNFTRIILVNETGDETTTNALVEGFQAAVNNVVENLSVPGVKYFFKVMRPTALIEELKQSSTVLLREDVFECLKTELHMLEGQKLLHR